MQQNISQSILDDKTMALIPAADPIYGTVILETEKKRYVKETPLQLIKVGCLQGGAAYEGRRLAVIYQTGFSHKVPIPVDPFEITKLL